MLKVEVQMQIKSQIQWLLGDTLGVLIQGFAVDAAQSYYDHIHWQRVGLCVRPDEIIFQFFNVQERKYKTQRVCDTLTIKPAEGYAVVQPGELLVEIAIDDFGTEPYYMGLERCSMSLPDIKRQTQGLYIAMDEIRRKFSIFDFARGPERRALAELLGL